MKHSMTIISFLMAVCFLAAGLLNFLSPSYARLDSRVSWTGLVPQTMESAEEIEETAVSLLTANGQTVLLGEWAGELYLPLGVPNEGLSVCVNNESWAKADIIDVGYGAELRIESWLERVPAENEDLQNEEEKLPDETLAEEGEQGVQDTVEEPLTEEMAQLQELESSGPDQENIVETEVLPETETTQTSGSTDSDSDQSDINDEEVTDSLPEPELPDEESDKESSETTEEMERRPDGITITVSWTDGYESKGAVFVLASRLEEMPSGDVSADPQLRFYHPKIPIVLSADPVSETKVSFNGGMFPAMTQYTVEGSLYLLYFPDYLYLPAGTTAVLDLPLNEDGQDILLSGGMTATALSYYELPDVNTGEDPVIMGNCGLLIPMPYTWGSTDPVITIERLEMGEAGLEWIQDKSIECAESTATGELQMLPSADTVAGSYHASIVWADEMTEYYRLEFSFFVFYDSGITKPNVTLYRYVGSGMQNPLGEGQEIEVELTYYCGCSQCCGQADHVTASGKTVARGMVAMSEDYPFGTQIVIDGVMYTVEDRGGGITGNRVDIYVPTHEEALRMGKATAKAIIYSPEIAEEDLPEQLPVAFP